MLTEWLFQYGALRSPETSQNYIKCKEYDLCAQMPRNSFSQPSEIDKWDDNWPCPVNS